MPKIKVVGESKRSGVSSEIKELAQAYKQAAKPGKKGDKLTAEERKEKFGAAGVARKELIDKLREENPEKYGVKGAKQGQEGYVKYGFAKAGADARKLAGLPSTGSKVGPRTLLPRRNLSKAKAEAKHADKEVVKAIDVLKTAKKDISSGTTRDLIKEALKSDKLAHTDLLDIQKLLTKKKKKKST